MSEPIARGLEGVNVTATKLCRIDGIKGELIYSGYDIFDLAEKSTFEEVAFLLWNLRLPTAAELASLKKTLLAERNLSDLNSRILTEIVGQIRPMRALEMAVITAGALDKNSSDLTNSQLKQTAARLTAINPRAPMRVLAHGQVELDFILDIRGFNLNEQLLAADVPASGKMTYRPVSFRTADGDEIGSLLLEHDGLVDLDKIGAFVQDILDRYGDDLLRYKGVLAVPGQDQKLVFQGVHRLAGFDLGNPWGEETRRSRIVVIGRRLPAEELRAGFAATLL